MRRALAGLALAALLFGAGMAPAAAEQKREFEHHAVHFALMNSTQLQPEVAARYGIRRSRNLGLLMLSPMRREGDRERPVAAAASGEAANLIGHRQRLAFQAIQDGPAHYLIAVFEISDREFLNFRVELVPADTGEALAMRFSQQFFID